MDKQAMINNMRGESIIAWARGMGSAGYLLKNATTNIDIYGIFRLFWAATDIAEAAMGHQWEPELYWRMRFASEDIEENLGPYCDGAPATVRYINSTAIEMFGNLTEKIWHVTRLISDVDLDLKNLEGTDPIQLLKEKGILDDIIAGCTISEAIPIKYMTSAPNSSNLRNTAILYLLISILSSLERTLELEKRGYIREKSQLTLLAFFNRWAVDY